MKEITLISELSLWARRKRDQKATYKAWSVDFEAQQQKQQQGPASPRKAKSFNASKEKAVRETSSRVGSSTYGDEAIDYDSLLEKWSEPKRQNGEVSDRHCFL